MTTGDLAVYVPENLLVTIVESNYSESGGVARHKVRPANNKKADTRILPADRFRPATDDDQDYITYLFTDEETGQINTLKLGKAFIRAVRSRLSIGKATAVTTKTVLESIGETDTDSTRRQFRAAVAYWIERGIVICSTSSGYFVADNEAEVLDCVTNKERQAEGNLRRARLLKSMDVEQSKQLFTANS